MQIPWADGADAAVTVGWVRCVRALGWNINLKFIMISVLESRAQRTGWWHGHGQKIWGNQCATEVRTPSPKVSWTHFVTHVGPRHIFASAISIGLLAPLQDAFIKYYDIQREAQRADYTIHNGGLQPDCKNSQDISWFLKQLPNFEFQHGNSTSPELCHATSWGLQHSQISPRRFYMSKIKCGSKMMPGSSTCLIKWSVTIQLPWHHEYMSAQGFSD